MALSQDNKDATIITTVFSTFYYIQQIGVKISVKSASYRLWLTGSFLIDVIFYVNGFSCLKLSLRYILLLILILSSMYRNRLK